MRVLFLHGLESGPQGQKARYLAGRFEARTPDMQTASSAAARLQEELRLADRSAVDGPETRRKAEVALFERSLALQRAEVASFRPDVLVGSSFGGALAVALLREGAWKGPTLLLAQAALLATRRAGVLGPEAQVALPEGVDVLLVHGTRDDVVPLDDSRKLAATSARARLVEVDDGHRLETLCADERLADLVRQAARQSST